MNNFKRGEGTGFSSEIETSCWNTFTCKDPCVARELASHLRLKPRVTAWCAAPLERGEGTGFSSEIETQTLTRHFPKFLKWRGNWLLI